MRQLLVRVCGGQFTGQGDHPTDGARNVQRDFRKVMNTAGLVGRKWTPRELQQSFVSLLSDERVPLEVISRIHSGL